MTMFIWSNQLEPIISHPLSYNVSGPLSEYNGIVVDLMQSLPNSLYRNIWVNLNSRKRGEEELYQGLVDMSILSPRWLRSPESLIYSAAIFKHREYLYATKPISSNNVSDLLNQVRVCVRRAYRFPNVDPFFENGLALKIENDEESVLFELLLRGRCDFVLTNEFVANAIIEHKKIENIIYKTDYAIDEVGFTIAFHPRHKAFVEQLNQHIVKLRENGELTRIINSHIRVEHKMLIGKRTR